MNLHQYKKEKREDKKSRFPKIQKKISKKLEIGTPYLMNKSTKEYLYVGHYIDTDNNFLIKIGTTNDLKRRQTEHTRNYKRAKNYTMPKSDVFVYDWFLPLSKYNTLRYEDTNRKRWQEENIGQFVRNDRFKCDTIPQTVTIKIRKEYVIKIKAN